MTQPNPRLTDTEVHFTMDPNTPFVEDSEMFPIWETLIRSDDWSEYFHNVLFGLTYYDSSDQEVLPLINYTRDGRELREVVASLTLPVEYYKDISSILSEYRAHFDRRRLIITRIKTEVAPWHECVPQDAPPEAGHYFEGHVKAWNCPHHLAWEEGFHVSKRFDRDNFILTMRTDKESRADFELGLQVACSRLMNAGVIIGSTGIEYCTSDDNVALDDEWMKM